MKSLASTDTTVATNQTALDRLGTSMASSLHHHWRMFLTEGVILVVLGVIAVILPPLATIAVEFVIGWVLILSGLVGVFSTLKMYRTPGLVWSALSAVIALGAGVLLLAWPASGAFSLTVILTVFLAFEGIASIMLALQQRSGFAARWKYLLISGVIDLGLAGLIVSGLPGTAAWAIGLLVGINLTFGGGALISMALHARRTAAP